MGLLPYRIVYTVRFSQNLKNKQSWELVFAPMTINVPLGVFSVHKRGLPNNELSKDLKLFVYLQSKKRN